MHKHQLWRCDDDIAFARRRGLRDEIARTVRIARIGFGRAQPVGIFVELLSQAKRRQQRRIVVVIRVINDGVDQVCRGWQAICQISGCARIKRHGVSPVLKAICSESDKIDVRHIRRSDDEKAVLIRHLTAEIYRVICRVTTIAAVEKRDEHPIQR